MRMIMRFVYKGSIDTVSNNADKILLLHSYISNLLDINMWVFPSIKKRKMDMKNIEHVDMLRNVIINDKIKEEKKLTGVKIDENTEENYGIRTSFYSKDIIIDYNIGIKHNESGRDVILLSDFVMSNMKQLDVFKIFKLLILTIKPMNAILADSDFLYDELDVQVGELWPGNSVYLSKEIDIPDFEHPEVGLEYIDDIGRIYKLNSDLGYDTEECKQILAEMYEYFKKHIDYFV